ncbi:MAG: T9SS type A sorting domain-containing protein [Ignavibacteria bacterium]|nr:T9SS type A sorting domain-containing protein [Ignavibacteria bacterium]
MTSLASPALFTLLILFCSTAFSQTDPRERLKYPLAMNIEGKTFPEPEALNSNPMPSLFINTNISQNSAPQNEPSACISRKDSNRVVAAWRDFRYGIDPNPIRRVGYSYSTDGGISWAVSQVLDSTLLPGGLTNNSDPVVTVDTSGNFYIAVIAGVGAAGGNLTVAIYKSIDSGVTFSQAFICSQTGIEDKEWITTDLSNTSPYNNNLYISWTSLSLNGIYLTKSSNSGSNWSAPVRVSELNNVQGSNVCISKDGQINVVWMRFIVNSDITYDRSTNGGASFSSDIIVSSGAFPTGLPNNINTFPFIASDNSSGPRSGWLYIVFADKRNGDCDVFLVRSTNAGVNWSAPARVNNDSLGNGKSQYWPVVAVNEYGNIAILFMDNRNTSSNSIIEAYLARSYDGGSTFSNELISSEPSPTAIPGSNVRFGDYIDMDYMGSRILPVWTDERAGGFNMEIYTSEIYDVLPVSGISGIVPTGYRLNQNYPNPFNPSTVISFSLPEAAIVTIEIYTALGTFVKTIASGNYPAGNHSLNFNSGSLSSGVYFYKMNSAKFSSSRSMILIK